MSFLGFLPSQLSLAGGTLLVPYSQINLPFQQSSGSSRAQQYLTWLALHLMNLKAIWTGPFICSFSAAHSECISTPSLPIPSHLSCLHISSSGKLRGKKKNIYIYIYPAPEFGTFLLLSHKTSCSYHNFHPERGFAVWALRCIQIALLNLWLQ